jgi:sulfane dehydrogenase subunit SoxC
VPVIDPAEHRLLIHGLVDRPLIFTMAELRRFPSVSRICLSVRGEYHLSYGPHEAPTCR